MTTCSRIAERLAATRAQLDLREREHDAQLAVQQERADADAAARAAAGEETRAELEGRIVEITRAYDGCVVDLTRARDGKVQIKVHAERVQATMAELERRLRDAEEGLDEAAALKDEKVSFILF